MAHKTSEVFETMKPLIHIPGSEQELISLSLEVSPELKELSDVPLPYLGFMEYIRKETIKLFPEVSYQQLCLIHGWALGQYHMKSDKLQ